MPTLAAVSAGLGRTLPIAFQLEVPAASVVGRFGPLALYALLVLMVIARFRLRVPDAFRSGWALGSLAMAGLVFELTVLFVGFEHDRSLAAQFGG